MAWRSVESLKKLRAQVMAKWPKANPKLFGTIGDAAHQAGYSDHNQEDDGTVDALDIPHQPEIGLDAHKLANTLLNSHDRRISYIISNRRIGGDENYAKRNGVKPWTWGPYNGKNPHDEHIHVSVNDAFQDDTSPWDIGDDDMTTGWKSGRGSWYSQYEGKNDWVDNGDKPNSNALGVPDYAQGVAFFDQDTLGDWFEIQYPNGRTSIEQQTEIGPNPGTGRTIDISAVAAERAGYIPHYVKGPNQFPTDATFYWREVSPPAAVAALPKKDQALAYYKLRGSIVPVDEEPEDRPVSEPKSLEQAFREYREAQANWTEWLEEHVKAEMPAASNEFADLFEEIKPVLMRNLGTLLPIVFQLPISVQAKLFRLGLSGGLPMMAMQTEENGTMQGTQSWLASKGIWGGIIAVAAPILGQLLGWNITSEDTQSVVELISSITASLGGLLAIWGRVSATKMIGTKTTGASTHGG